MADLRDARPAPRIPVWLAGVLLILALAVAATVADEIARTAATAGAVLSGWLVVAGTARRWTIGPWGALAAGAAACGVLLVREPGYRVPGVLFLVLGLLALPVLLVIARIKRSADRLPDPTRSTEGSDLFGSGRVDSGESPFG